MNKFLCLLFSTALLFSGAVYAEHKDVPESIEGIKNVSAEDVVAMITSEPNLVVIDARKATDRASAGWIEGSIGLPNTDTNVDSLAKVIKTKDTPVLFYCNGVKCGRSVESVQSARTAGYKNIYWFRGGWAEWLDKGLPVTRH